MKTSPATAASLLAGFAATLLLVAPPLSQAQEPTPDPSGAMDPKARALLESVTAFLARTDALSVDAVMKIEQTLPEVAGGGEQKMEMIQTLSLKRPDRFSLVTKGDSGMSASAYAVDGTMRIVVDRDTVIEGPFEGGLSGAFSSEKFAYDAESDSNPLLDQNTAAALIRQMIFDSEDHPWDRNITGMKYDGEEEIEGQKAHKLTLTSNQKDAPGGGNLEIDIALWIAAGEQPLPLRVVPDTTKIIEAMTRDNEAFSGMKVAITGDYAGWVIGKEPRESAFKPDFNDDATVYEDFAGFLAAMNDQGGGAAGDPTTLVGGDAPDFEITMLDGSTFRLSELKGKKTVILDFWATWCGPCVQALPILMETAKAFADKDVILVAMNQAEDRETITAFLGKKEWNDLRVALDSEGAAAGQYMVSGIPQTVIVGKDGKVKKVHVGFAPGLKETLSAELDEILAE